MCTVLVCQTSYVDCLHERKEFTKAVGSGKQALHERHVKGALRLKFLNSRGRKKCAVKPTMRHSYHIDYEVVVTKN